MSYSPAITLSYRVLDECSFIANSITNSGTISVICDIRNLVRSILVRNIDNELSFCLVICKYLVKAFCNLYSVREIAFIVKSSLPDLVVIAFKYKLVTSLLFSECDVTCKLIFYLYLCLITSFLSNFNAEAVNSDVFDDNTAMAKDNRESAYDKESKSIVYRISVNAEDIKDVQGEIGKFFVNDNLEAGFKFAPIIEDKTNPANNKYFLYFLSH